MKAQAKWALAISGAAALGGLLIVGAATAEPGFGHGMRMGMMGGGMGHELLRSVDSNADGALAQDEINAAVDARYATFDANKDGQLALDEFQALWADLTRPIAVRAFQFLDPNGDAQVARAEVGERVGSLVSRFDRNDDGMLSPDDHRRGHRGDHGGSERQDDEERRQD